MKSLSDEIGRGFSFLGKSKLRLVLAQKGKDLRRFAAVRDFISFAGILPWGSRSNSSFTALQK
jgi:hypothetical protein